MREPSLANMKCQHRQEHEHQADITFFSLTNDTKQWRTRNMARIPAVRYVREPCRHLLLQERKQGAVLEDQYSASVMCPQTVSHHCDSLLLSHNINTNHVLNLLCGINTHTPAHKHICTIRIIHIPEDDFIDCVSCKPCLCKGASHHKCCTHLTLALVSKWKYFNRIPLAPF